MKPRDALLQNPFAALGASPRDSRARLIELADEAALFGDVSARENMNRLLQPGTRLEAELGWFPATAVNEIRQVVDYARRDRLAPTPTLRSDSALAHFNACRVLLAYWPVRDDGDALALCESLVIAEHAVAAAQTAQDIKTDRSLAGMPGEIDRSAVAARLEALCHDAARQALSACGPLDESQRAAVFKALADRYGSGEALYHFNPFVAMLVEEHALSVAEDVRRCKRNITMLREEIGALYTTRLQAVDKGKQLATQVGRWATLHGPELAMQAARKSLPKATENFVLALPKLTDQVNNRFCRADMSSDMARRLYDVCIDILQALLPAVEGYESVDQKVREGLAQLETDRGLCLTSRQQPNEKG